MQKTYTLDLNATLSIEDNIIVFTQGKSGFYYVIILGALVAGAVFSYQVLQAGMPYLIVIPAIALLVVTLITILSKRITLDKGKSLLTVEWLLFIQYKVYTSTSPFTIKNIHIMHEAIARRDHDDRYRMHDYYYLMNGKRKLCSLGTENTAQELSELLSIRIAHKL